MTQPGQRPGREPPGASTCAGAGGDPVLLWYARASGQSSAAPSARARTAPALMELETTATCGSAVVQVTWAVRSACAPSEKVPVAV